MPPPDAGRRARRSMLGKVADAVAGDWTAPAGEPLAGRPDAPFWLRLLDSLAGGWGRPASPDAYVAQPDQAPAPSRTSGARRAAVRSRSAALVAAMGMRSAGSGGGVATAAPPLVVTGGGWSAPGPIPFHRRLRSYLRALLLLDAAFVVVGVVAGHLLQAAGTGVGLFIVGAWLPLLWWMRAYEPQVLGHGTDEYRLVTQAGFRLCVTLALADYLFGTAVSAGYLVTTFSVGTAGVLIGRWVARRSLHRARARGQGWSHRVLVVGDVPHVMELVGQLRRGTRTGYQVVGVCVSPTLATPQPQHLGEIPVVGSFRTIVEGATAVGADTIAVTASAELTASRLRRLGWQLEGSGIDLMVAPAMTDVAGPRIHIRPVAGLPLIHVEPPDLSGGAKLVKGLMDRLIAVAALVLLSPLMLVIAIAIRVTSPGPVLFRQRRVGQDGVEFDVYKFRTMVKDAERLLDKLAALNEADGLLFKIRKDPRVTRIGRVLRRYSLDDLPQLFNVLGGSMSIVGPRPPLPSEVAQYDGDVARRLLVKPGITGLWQVSGRSDLSWEDGIRLDLYYVENWSLATDLSIMWRTFAAVVGARGSY